ncbi:SAM-dependent methyltransferase [Bradyrhizobium sp. MOS003]|uniref:class I SAM-dependent methyltransferase n=1 Tax=Bradyrhizobium sp. MOS003 TaxID=2133946 RepID=UPI000D12B8F2|nr:SAM-dependent methyltransferase [Bradyrhizobium sp. MOS003]PSO17080.1 SAM-dependent methyltransferase [Bradyrhizobium sp. MOS003]
MTRRQATLPPEYFEEKYKSDIDPWRFRTSEYERDKYRATLRSLTRESYAAGLEVGCSIGVLTKLLSARCVNLLAIDTSETAIEAARSVNDGNVSFRRATLPEDYPAGTFDLIVLSEVLYYFEKADLERVARSCIQSIARDGEVVLCHWLGETDYPLTGREASELFAEVTRSVLPVRSVLHDEVYRLERFSAS